MLLITKDQADLKVMFETIVSAFSFQKHPSKQGLWGLFPLLLSVQGLLLNILIIFLESGGFFNI